MELDKFIAKSLEQIISGVGQAQASKGSERINPHISGGVPQGKAFGGGHVVHFVEFDIAVTVEDKNNADAGAKISVLGASLGGKIDSGTLLQTATRIKFDVPISYPDGASNDQNQ